VQSYFLSLWLSNPSNFQGLCLVIIDNGLFQLTTVLTLTAATFFVIYLAKLIDRHGIGNGIAMLVLGGVIYKLIGRIYSMRMLAEKPEVGISNIIIIIAIAVLFTWALFYITAFSLKAKIKTSSGKEISIALRPAILGTAPIIAASFVSTLPLTLAGLAQSGFYQKLSMLFFKNYWSLAIVKLVLTLFFTYFYIAAILAITPLGKMLKRYGYTDKEENAKSILGNKAINNLAIIIGSILALLVILPRACDWFLKTPFILSSLFGASFLILGVGAVFSLLKQMEAKLIMAEAANQKWVICYTALDEIEATIKQAYLKDNGIESVIEPSRFTWGMPIKTIIDEYRIWVGEEGLARAKELL